MMCDGRSTAAADDDVFAVAAVGGDTAAAEFLSVLVLVLAVVFAGLVLVLVVDLVTVQCICQG